MNKTQLEELRGRLTQEVEGLGYELIDVEFVKEHGDRYLRFFIYRPDGISVDDCEAVSEHLNPILDELDPIDEAYFLEVSSPDLNRPLKTDRDLERNLGEQLELSFYQKLDGQKKRTGKLVAFDDKTVTLEVSGKEETYEREAISKIKIAIVF